MIEVIKQLVDALENHSAIKHPQQIHYRDAVIQVGKQAIAQLALDAKAKNARELGLDYEQEPVFCEYCGGNDENPPDHCMDCARPQRTWVGLTRIELIKCGVLPYGMSYELYQAIEAKLKEKNT